MKIYGYIRVSSVEQNTDRQFAAMQELSIPQGQIYTDKQSGKDFDRPKYAELMEKLKQGDLLYIKSIDRLGRNYEEIQNQWRIITKEKGVDIVVLDMPLLDTRTHRDLLGTFISDLVLQVLSFCSHSERENIRQRQAEGIKAAKLRGVRFGRPIKKPPKNFKKVIQQWELSELTTRTALELTGLTESTFYRRYREYKIGKSK